MAACLDDHGARARPAPPGCGPARRSTVPALAQFPASSWARRAWRSAGWSMPSCRSGWAPPPTSRRPIRTVLRCLELRSFARSDLGRRLVRKGHPQAGGGGGARAGRRVWACSTMPPIARNYVQTRAAEAGAAPAALAISWPWASQRSLIDRALAAEWPEGSDRSSMPLALATKRAAQLGALPRQIKRRRVLAYLARRGFSGREVTEMVEKVV